MKRWIVAGLLMGTLSGCILFGSGKGKDGEPTDDGKGGIVGTVANWIWPGAGTLIAGAVGVYTDLKRRQWKAATLKTVEAIEQFKASPAGSSAWSGSGGLKQVLMDKHGERVGALVNRLTKNSNRDSR